MNKKIFGYLFYALALIIDAYYIVNAINPNISINFEVTVLFIIISLILFYFGGVLLSKYYKNDKPLKINLWLFFILYILLFIDLTLFDTTWGRNGLFVSFNLEYLKNSVNLIPFRTIYEYLIENFNNLTDSATIFYNILGNFVALMPMAFFLPLLFKKQNNFKTFFLTMLTIILGIELLQLFGGAGRFDIDDIILNVGGSLIMFKVLKIKTINDLIKNIFLLEKNKIDKKKLIKLICLFVMIILAIYGVIKYHDYLYQKNLDILQYRMKIVDESSTCQEGLDKFYENEFYSYYFPCHKSGEVYAIINDKDKYLVKDLLNDNKSPYRVDIQDIEEELKNYKIEYTKEYKYEHTTFSIKLPVKNEATMSPRIKVNVDNKVVEAKLDYKNATLDYGKYIISLHFIPKEVGNTTVLINTYEVNSNNLINVRKYNVEVDKDLKVKYELIDNIDLLCLESFLDGYIISESNTIKDEKLSNIIAVNLSNVKNSLVKVTNNDNIYIIIDTEDKIVIDALTNYFAEIYPNYQQGKYHNFNIYLSNGNSDFNLKNDLKGICQ